MTSRTYYRGHDAVVTDQRFTWLTSPARDFAVRELRNVGLVREETNPVRAYAPRVAAGLLALAAALWLVQDRPVVYAVGFLAAATPLCFWRGPARRWEMRATYRGRSVLLYASPDARIFNQVARALRRAVEDHHPPARYDMVL